jgi:hypothetical protein
MPSTTTAESPRPGRAFRPRFRLATLLALVTLAAIGSWYWWRRPFTVERNGLNRRLGSERQIVWANVPEAPPADPFAPPPSSRDPFAQVSKPQASQGQRAQVARSKSIVVVREVETVRRLWGGKTIRNGRVTGFNEDGKRIELSQYREGTLHGPHVRWFADGSIREQGEYIDGKKNGQWVSYCQQIRAEPLAIVPVKCVSRWKRGIPDGIWTWHDAAGELRYEARFADGKLLVPFPQEFDSGLAECLKEGRIDDANLVLMLLSPSAVEFVETPLKDATDYLAEKHAVPIILDARSLEEGGVNIDEPVSLHIQEGPPFIECLGRVLKSASKGSNRLVVDYRHGYMTITTPKAAAAGDTTGVSQLKIPPGSPLASIWNRRVDVECIETPLPAALKHLEEQVGMQGLFVLDEIPEELQNLPVTKRIKGHPFHQALGLLLSDFGRARLKDDRWIAISLE